MKIGWIYVIANPFEELPRYVGKTTCFKKRQQQHLRDAESGFDKTHKGRWIRSLLAQGIRPQFRLVMCCFTREGLNDAEREWIAHYLRAGARLTNLTAGGEGGGYTPTQETRDKIAARMRGRVFSPETIARMSASKKGRKLTSEWRAKVIASIMAGLHDKDRKDKHRAGMQSPKCVAQRARLHQLMRGRTQNPDRVAERAAKCQKRVIDQHGTIYESMKAAGVALGVLPSNISTVVSGKRPHTRGFVFRIYETESAS